MQIQDLKEQQLILLECISGSKAYGLDMPESDTDIRGVFYLPKQYFYGTAYVPQVADKKNDIIYYELGRFIELLSKNNPNILELLATPEDKILFCHPIMKALKVEDFLSKKCRHTFGGYALAQIQKAQGLNKKIVNPVDQKKKNILEFCYVLEGQGTLKLNPWLERRDLEQSQIGLVNVPHARDVYAMFYDEDKELAYKGVMQKETANEVLLSSIPKGATPMGYLYFNQDGYTRYCKDYREYWEWVANRNEHRYAHNVSHGKNYDSKNMMHTFRLLDMAEEILRFGQLQVRRPNREELLSIRKGSYTYNALIQRAEAKMKRVEQAFQVSSLPEQPNLARIDQVLVEMRTQLYTD